MKLPWSNGQIRRILIGFLAILSILVLMALATGLDNIVFEPARHYFSFNEPRGSFWEWTRSIGNPADLTIGQVVIVAGALLLVIVLILLLLPPEARKRFVKTVLRVGVIIWAIHYVLTRALPPDGLVIESQNAALENVLQELPTPPPFTPPIVPETVRYLVSLFVVLVLVAGGFLLYRILQPPRPTLRKLVHAARSALKDLDSGHRWDDTVITCYIRMSTAVREHCGLLRQSAMTPAEFAQQLVAAGLPSDPVRRLTRLFEKARYSQHATSVEDVNNAVACLTSILNAVGEKA